METVTKKLYEGMFLVDPAEAADWGRITAALESVLKKADGEIVSVRRWDERKLAYEINGKSRGTYILCYFRADGQKLREVERAVQLSEQIMRVLILSAEKMGKEDMEKETPAMRVEREQPKAAEAVKQMEVQQEGRLEEPEEPIKSFE